MKSKLIAITGGIGSGKSEVIKYLQSLGYATIDCDVLAREVAYRKQTVEQVRQLLGCEYVVDGQLNRQAIRDKIFADNELLQQYNAIFFAEVKKLLDMRVAQLSNVEKIFVEISVFDAFEYVWDEVWLIDADENMRVNRAIARDGSSRKTIEEILHCQNVIKNYTLKIVNDATIDNLKIQVDNAIKTI